MICVFFQLPLTGVQGGTFIGLNGRAATAAAEVLNTVEWLTVD
jgi:hypothetical protein